LPDRSFNDFDRQDIFFYLSIEDGDVIGMTTVVDGYRFDQFFILEQDTGAVIAGIAGGEVSAEHLLSIEGFAAGFAMIMRAMAGFDKAQAIDQGELFGS